MDDDFDYPVADPDWFGVAEGSSNPIVEKSFTFALVTIALYKRLQEEREFVVSKQLLRSGTSVGANVEEATAAASRKDFIYKMTLASKEARESKYWLLLISKSDLAPGVNVSKELELAQELVRMLTSIVKTASRTDR